MSVQLHGTAGIDGVSVNATTPNTGNFTSINISTGVLSATTGQNLNFSTDGSQKLRIDTAGNVKLLANGSFQNASGDAFSPYAGIKNKLINGNFDIWQRGVTQTSNGYGSDDRWRNFNSGSTKVHSRENFTIGQTAVPNNPKYYSRTVVTSVAGASNYVVKTQFVEDVTKSSGKTYTLSFWAKADGNKKIATEFGQYFGTGGSPSATIYSIGIAQHSLTTQWQKFTTTVNIPSVSGKTLGTDNNSALNVIFWFDGGSSYNTRNNSLGQQSGTFDIAQIQLEEGPVATTFENRQVGLEMTLCQRYYEQISNVAAFGFGITANTVGGAIAWQSFNVAKRAIPTVAAVGAWNLTNCTGPYAGPATLTGVRISAITTGNSVGCSFSPNSADDAIIVDAEIN